MAGFKTHISTSTVIGIGFGAAGYAAGMPLSTCMVSAGLCSVAGMLPDLDSGSGVPLRETITFIAAGVPMLMLERFQSWNLNHEQIVLAAGLIYVLIRFGVAEIFKRYTVHRGMWHSIPAAISAGLITFLICNCHELAPRLFKAGAVVLGFMTHLVLDEIYSFQIRRGRLRIKKSFGTALKFWSRRSAWANISTYGKLILFALLALGDPILSDHIPASHTGVPRTARKLFDKALGNPQDGSVPGDNHNHLRR